MKALLLKDCYNLKKSSKTILIVFLFYGIFGILSEQSAFLTSMVAIICAIMPFSTFSYDDFSKWNNYALTMPITRKQIVYAKYLISVLMLAVGSIVSFIFGILSVAINGTQNVKLTDLLLSTGGVVLLCLLVIAIILPIIIKFGVEKGRIAMIAVFLLPTGLLLLASKLPIHSWLPSGDQLESFLKLAFICSPVVILLALLLSIMLSVRIFSKIEF